MPNTFHKLSFANNVTMNASLQSGDIAYKVTNQTFISSNDINYAMNSPVKLGEISKVVDKTIYIKDMNVSQPTNAGDFIMFAKNKAVNKSGIKGYYAKVKLENDSDELVELFSIASEISPSSK